MIPDLIRRRLPLALVSCTTLAFLGLWLAWLGQPDFTLDDAYIAQHAADALLRGHESRFVGSSVLHGVTSLVHVLLISALAILTGTPAAQALVAALAFFLFVLSCYSLGRLKELTPIMAGALAVACATAGHSFFHFGNGLETGLAVALLTWSLVLFYHPTPPHAAAFCLLGVMPYVRPELGVWSACLFLRFAWQWREQPRRCLRPLLISAAAALPFALILWLGTGSPIPNTIAAKRFFFAEECWPTISKLQTVFNAFRGYLVQMGPTAIGLIGLALTSLAWPAAAFLITIAGSFFFLFPGGSWHNDFRYIWVATPFIVIGWVQILTHARWRGIATWMLLFALLANIAAALQNFTHYKDGISFTRSELGGVANWVAKRVPPVGRHEKLTP